MSLLRTPSFWYPQAGERPGFCGALLSPLSWLYNAGRVLSQRDSAPYKATMPVICVGNVVAGGSGKTPSVLALMDLIQRHKLVSSPCFLTRGYGGTFKGTTIVEPGQHKALQVGDEALLLARTAAVIQSPDRAQGAQCAEKQSHDLIIMDDGFQNLSLHKDIHVLVIDGASGFGNKCLLPAGPLREPIKDALARTQAVVLIGQDRHNARALLPDNLPVFEATIEISTRPDASKSYIAFCGLARPEKFYDSLRGTGVELVETHDYADHYTYKAEDIAFLQRRADELGATLITTEKDMVKLEHFDGVAEIAILPIALKWHDESALLTFMKEQLA